MRLNFSPFPGIATRRLELRQLTSADAQNMFQLRSDPRVMKYLDRPAAKSPAEADLYIADMNRLIGNNEIILWGITKPPAGEIIGTICFWKIEKQHYRAEIGYMLHPDYHGHSIMKEALTAVIQFGFDEMQLHSITANVNPENAASIALLKSCGFVQEAYFRENYYFNGKFLDAVIFTLLNTASV